MDNNNLDIEITFVTRDGQRMTYETLREIMELLLTYRDDFLDIIVTLCFAQEFTDIVRKILEEYGSYFCFEAVMDIPDFTEEWADICRDFGLLPLFYVQCPAERDFHEYCESIKSYLNMVEGHCRAIVFIPASSAQLEMLPELYSIINECSIKPCFMRLKFKRVFEITEKAKEIYKAFIDERLPEYVLFDNDIVQYYNLNNNVRFRTIECPKNYIWRLRLSRNSNACIVFPDKTLHEIGMTEKFFPGKLPLQPEISIEQYELKRKSFFLSDGQDRFLYRFRNESRCKNCRLREYCQDGVGEWLDVPNSFCDQMEFFAYGFFKLKDIGEQRLLEKYPARFPTRGVDAIGMAATVAQLGEKEGIIPPVKVIPGKQVRLKSNIERLTYLIEFDPLHQSMNIKYSLLIPKYLEKLKSLGISEPRVQRIIDFVKRYDLKVFPRDLGVYEGQLFMYNFVPTYRDFEQIDNLLFDVKSKKRIPNKPLKMKTT